MIETSVGGNEQSDLYLLNTATGELKTLQADTSAVFAGAIWRRDSRAIAFRSNTRLPQDFYVYVRDLGQEQAQLVYSAPGFHTPVDFSRDGSRLVLLRYNSATHTQLFEVEPATQEAREITPPGEAWLYAPIGYTADERHFLVTTNYEGDLDYVAAIDLEDRTITPVTPELRSYQVDGAGFNEDRSLLTVLTNEDGYGAMHLYETEGYQPYPLPPMEQGVITDVSFTRRLHAVCAEQRAPPRHRIQVELAPAVVETGGPHRGGDVRHRPFGVRAAAARALRVVRRHPDSRVPLPAAGAIRRGSASRLSFTTTADRRASSGPRSPAASSTS